MIKCKVCGCEFTLVIDKHYVARDSSEYGIVTAFKSTEGKFYDSFDCPACGCQIIAQERKRTFIDVCFTEEVDDDEECDQSHDPVNHPSHYTQNKFDTQNKFESIDEMMIVFGPETVYHFCICNAWKYKNRAPYKGNFEEDMKKADWYLTKAKEIKGGNLWQE